MPHTVFENKAEIVSAINDIFNNNSANFIDDNSEDLHYTITNKYQSVSQWEFAYYDNSTQTLKKITDFSELFKDRNFTALTNDPAGLKTGLSSWIVNYVENMSSMFKDSTGFDQDLSSWNVSSVTNMANMFENAESFNSNLSNWSVSNVTNMESLFSGASLFNADLGSWNVSSVTNMNAMFKDTTSLISSTHFNRLTNWNVSNVVNMNEMFSGSTNFNPIESGIRIWYVPSLTSATNMFYGLTLESPHSDALDANGTPNDITTFFARSGGAAGDPHIHCIDGSFYDFRYHGYIRLLETENVMINVKCAPGFNQQSKMDYFTHAFIKYNNNSATLKLGWRGNPVTIIENNGLELFEEKLDFNSDAKRFCETCRGWSSMSAKKCIKHEKEYNHVVSQLIRNQISLKTNSLKIFFQNVNESNGQPCSISFNGHLTNKVAGLIAGAEWADLSILESLDDVKSLLPSNSKTI